MRRMSDCLRFLLVPCLFVAVDVAAQRCQDISAADIRNEVVETRAAPGVLDQQFRFRNGVFDELQPDGTVMWRFQISKDLTGHPAPHTTIRFIQISGDHLSGSGTRNYVMGFRCTDGLVKNVFQKVGEDLTLVSVSADILQLRAPIWKSSDAHCCPFGEKDTSFAWDGRLGIYVETGSKETSRR
jgi:hypothetical protein